MPATKQINAHFTEDEITQIDAIRDVVGLSRGAFVRLCVQSMLAKKIGRKKAAVKKTEQSEHE